MTCVVGVITENGRVIMGADSSATDELIHTAHIESKVFVKGEFGIGYCHSFRLGQIIEFWFDPPPIPDDEEYLIRYMVSTFVPELKSVCEDNDYPNHDDEKVDWSIMVGVRGQLFTIESDWHVGHDSIPYASIGAGSSYALGSFYSTSLTYSNKHAAARIALEAAEKFCPYVIQPFNFIEV